MLLALHGQAQTTQHADTLALKAMNRTFRLLPIELSIDLALGVLIDSVPGLMAIGAGYDTAVWGRYQKGDSVYFSLSFRRDSASGPFGGHLTRRARVERAEVVYSTNDGAKAAEFFPRFHEATGTLGPPQFCERDTFPNDDRRSIVVGVAASWQRGDVTMTFIATMNAMEPVPKYREFIRRFYVTYKARRSSEVLPAGSLPTRHDSPCFFTDQEIRDRAVPLDSAAYEAWRPRLRSVPR